MMLRTILFGLTYFLSGCGEASVDPHWIYKAEFDTSKIVGVEKTMEEIAAKWGLRFHEENKEGMKFLTGDKDALAIAFYFNKDAILVMTNVGVGEVLSLMVIDYGKLPISDLKRMSAEVIATLNGRLGIEFKQEMSSVPITRTD